MELLCKRIRYSSEQLEDATFLEIKPRLAKKLIAFGEHYGKPKDNHLLIDLPLTQSDLGSMLGTSRETVNRQLRAWVKEEVISLEKNMITILDEDALLDASEDID